MKPKTRVVRKKRVVRKMKVVRKKTTGKTSKRKVGSKSIGSIAKKASKIYAKMKGSSRSLWQKAMRLASKKK
jgi:hypothetical protein